MDSIKITYLPKTDDVPRIHNTASIRNSEITGNVTIEEQVHVVNAVIRADEGTPFYIAKGSNVQDFAIIHAYTTQENGDRVEKNLVYVKNKGHFAVYISEFVSISHGVLIHGPSYIGKDTFIGFKSTIDAADIGYNVEIGAHSYIKNVLIPDNIGILPGSIITSPEDIEKCTTKLTGINERVVKVNIEMAAKYCLKK